MGSNYQRTQGGATITAATATVDFHAHAGAPVMVNRAAGCTITLPAATGSGASYEFIGIPNASGNQIIQVDSADDTMMGVAYLGNDSAGASCFYTADTSDTITLNGSTKGGYKGWRVQVTDVADTVWAVLVFSEASGTEATPFSAAVS